MIGNVIRSTRLRSRQHGVALISVLLVFALATVIAAEVMSRHQRDIRRTQTLIDTKQAFHFALSGEQYARQMLYRDFRDDRQRGRRADGFGDIWAQNFAPFEIEGGEMSIEISDLQARFNLNNLVSISGEANVSVLAQWQQLQQVLATEADHRDVLGDWLDADALVTGNGAEDEEYADYPTANRPMLDKTELRLLRDFSERDYQLVAPHVAALPKQLSGADFENTKYNINTVDAKLLEALSGLTAADVQQIVDRQQRGGLETLEAWYATSQGDALERINNQLVVESAFFEVIVTARYQQRTCVLTTQLYRDPDSGQLTVIHRQIGSG